jgi:hypothetical protein
MTKANAPFAAQQFGGGGKAPHAAHNPMALFRPPITVEKMMAREAARQTYEAAQRGARA